MSNNYRLQQGCQFVLIFSLLAAVLIVSGCGVQAAPKTYRVGVLSGFDYFAATTDGFKAKMSELGYVEGQNIVYDVQKTNFDIAAYKRILQKFVADKVDLILVFPTEASMEAKAATEGTNIPVVFANANIEDTNLVKNVREPGGNITGVRFPGPDIALKDFEILHDLVPQAKRIWLPYQQGYPIVASQLEVLRPAAKAAGVSLIEAPVDNPAELEAELQAHVKSGDIDIDAILLIPEPLAGTPDAFAIMAKFAYEHKVPIGGILNSTEGYSSIFGVNVNATAVGKQAAPLADKIFKGIQVGTIPVVSADSFLQINYNAAQKQGVTVPEGLLSQADEIIR